MTNIEIYTISFEQAKKQKFQGELELKLKHLAGKSSNSIEEANINLVEQAEKVGATYIFNKGQIILTRNGETCEILVFGDAYGPNNSIRKY